MLQACNMYPSARIDDAQDEALPYLHGCLSVHGLCRLQQVCRLGDWGLQEALLA